MFDISIRLDWVRLKQSEYHVNSDVPLVGCRIRILIGCRRLCSHTRLIIGCRPRSKLCFKHSTRSDYARWTSTNVMMYYLRKKPRNTVKGRKYWVHPILRQRFSLGTFQNLITELKSE